MRSRALHWICLLALEGCAEGASAPSVKGSPSDVKTLPGAYDGYAIVDGCQLSSIPYGILGTGSSWYDGVAPGDATRNEALTELAKVVVEPSLTEVASVGGVGTGTSCTLDAGVSVIMSDWRDVDRVFVLVGQALAEYDLREEVGLRVTVGSAD
jgi:hypothetical protein